FGGARGRPVRTSRRRAQGLVVTPAAPPEPVSKDGKVRLNHFLAMSGVCSRRAADGLIRGGRVEVNGELVTELGVRIDPEQDDVRFDGSRVRPERSTYVLFNKPKGVVCTNARHEQKKRVIDFLPTVKGRLFTVGRLDLDSEGLILLTNDGNFAFELTHPRFGVPKLYAVELRGRIEQRDIDKARGGVWLSEGPTTGMNVKVERTGKDSTFMKVTLREGKNREIRRVFAKLGYPVIELKRIRIGELTLHGLSPGEWRFLQRHEVDGLRAAAHAPTATATATAPANAFATAQRHGQRHGQRHDQRGDG
ncbi:MAG: pseudouridine synthase, partial [Planctomycetota bacterium]